MRKMESGLDRLISGTQLNPVKSVIVYLEPCIALVQ